MNVASILKWKGRNVLTSKPTETVLAVAKTLAEHKIGCIVLLDDEKNVAGIISERDIVRAIAKSGQDVLEQPVSICMTKEVITCRESDTINSLMAEMTSRRFRHLPVVEGGELDQHRQVQARHHLELPLAEKGQRHVRRRAAEHVGEHEHAVAAIGGFERRANGLAHLVDALQVIGYDCDNGGGVPGDVDGDLDTDFQDLLALLAAWGDCPDPPAECPADFDEDGVVGFQDLLFLLANWTG